MLGKLIKYDLKWINKSLSVFFIISLILSVITRIVGLFDSSFIGNILYSILKGICTTGCIAAIIINAVIRIWVRLGLNFYNDESYLTHTLPVSKSTLYDSKIISGIITMLISLVVIGISLLIVYLDGDMINKIKDIFSSGSIALIFINILIIIILEVMYLALCGIVGIIIGHRFNNGKKVKSILIGLGLYFLLQTIMLGIIFGISLLNNDISMLFSNTMSPDIKFEGAVKLLIIIVNIIYLVFNCGLYFVGKMLFKKGVNVE